MPLVDSDMIESSGPPFSDDEPPNSEDSAAKDTSESKLVRLVKSVIVNSDGVGEIDHNIISLRYYNCFNYSLLPKHELDVSVSLGITSPNPAEGKTLVASNLAVALALSYQRKTVLVDLNIHKPRLHEIFGTPLKPGLVEAFNDVAIHVSETRIDHLYLLPAGGDLAHPLGLEQFPFFRDVIYSLTREFSFVVVDMPSVGIPGFPLLFANQLSGLLVVLNAGRTRREEVDRMFRLLNEAQVYGFVFNRCRDEFPAPKGH